MTELLLADQLGVARAADLLRHGRLVAFGTETVYGLGADATNARAVAAIFDAKGRPHFNPLICHFADAERAFAMVVATDSARALAAAFWPGPLTLVLPRAITCLVALLAGAGLETLAVRVPAGDSVRALLAATDRPVAAPSANRSGRVSPTTADHVLAELSGRIDAVLDSGPCPVGLESAVLDLTGTTPFLLRPGGVTAEAIERVIGPIRRGMPIAAAEQSRGLRSPGLMISHYAPSLPVRLNAAHADPDEALLAFGPGPTAAVTYQLSAGKNLIEAAARLFDGLRTLDRLATAQGLCRIAVMPIPQNDLGEAINDRLARAASPR